MSKQPTYRRTIELPTELHRALEERAAAKGVTLATLIRDILERSAAAAKKEPAA